MLSQKDAEELTNLEELKVQARNELAEWYARHEEQLNQTKTLNRSVATTCSVCKVCVCVHVACIKLCRELTCYSIVYKHGIPNGCG